MPESFRDLCKVDIAPDGLSFLRESVRAERIKDDEEYEGVRLHVTSMLENAHITVQIDVGFGDRVVPEPEDIDFPVLLDFPAPHPKSYTRESVVAEKFEAMVKLGMLNSRMKDFFDLWSLSRDFNRDYREAQKEIDRLMDARPKPSGPLH